MADIAIEFSLKVGFPKFEAVEEAQAGTGATGSATDKLIATFTATKDCRISTGNKSPSPARTQETRESFSTA